MAKIGRKLRSIEGGRVAFMCPGCKTMHAVTIDGTRGWVWNGDADAPTFNPSVLVNQGGSNPTKPICHSFVRDGSIQFLSDCTHELAGVTVPLPDI